MFGKWRQRNLQHTYLLEFMLPNYCVSHAKESWLSLLPFILSLVPLRHFIIIIYWIMNVSNEAKKIKPAFVVISSTIRWGEGVLGWSRCAATPALRLCPAWPYYAPWHCTLRHHRHLPDIKNTCNTECSKWLETAAMNEFSVLSSV